MDRMIFTNESLWVTPTEAQRRTGVSLSAINELIEKGALRCVLGRIRLADLKVAAGLVPSKKSDVGKVHKNKKQVDIVEVLMKCQPITVEAHRGLKLYTVEQASRMLKISTDEVKVHARSGRLRSRSDGGKIYILASSLDAIMRKMTK